MNLDVLELILAELDSDDDLVKCALVSRTFLAAALPSLYRHVQYTIHHAKRDHDIQSPFATLAAHSHLLVHVKRIAVHAAPALNHAPNPPFLNDLTHTLKTATNLRSFVCTINILAPLLPYLIDKQRLHHIRITPSLGSRQVPFLQRITHLHSLALDSPSWNVIDALPDWSASMQRTLAHLTLSMSQDIDASLLNTTLANLPRLRGLHVISCPRISHSVVLKALSHTPDLLELSLTIFPSQEIILPPLNFPIPPLTHLSLDIRASFPALKLLIARIVSRLSPRYALAICGAWIGEIKSSSERADLPQNPASADGPGPTQSNHNGHVHDSDDPPLLTPPHPHHPNHNLPPNHPHPSNHFAFPFGFPPPNNDNNDNNIDPLPDPHIEPSHSLIAFLPSTLSVLHLPLLSPAALREVVQRCENIKVLGIVIGSSFASKAKTRSTKTNGRLASRSTTRTKQATVSGVRPEISELVEILSRARWLQDLIIDTSNTDVPSSNTAPDHHGAFRGAALLTPFAVLTLMRESPLLRRIVGEGRIWESPTPTQSSPVPFPQCLDIDLRLFKARCGPGASNHHHGYGPPGYGGYTHVEVENDPWFWLTGSASGGKFHSES